jgi:hypothetical protein
MLQIDQPANVARVPFSEKQGQILAVAEHEHDPAIRIGTLNDNLSGLSLLLI